MPDPLAPAPGTADRALQEAVANGQEGALTLFILRYQAFLKSQCRRLVGGNPEDAGELFSMVLLKICSEHPEQFRHIEHPGGWLVRIAQNKSIDLQRSRQAEARRGRELAVQEQDSDTRLSASPEQALLLGELLQQIRWAFGLLPARLRPVAELRLIDEASYEDIARVLGISQVNARKRVQEARRHLAQWLGHYLDRGQGAGNRENDHG